jgi:flagellar biogenesis protein FliO
MELVSLCRLFGACVVVGTVLYVLQLIARGAARRLASAAPGGRIVAVLETTALPNAASLHVVRVAERYLLVGRSPSALATLCEIPAESVSLLLAAPVACERGLGSHRSWVQRLCRMRR